MCRALWSSGRDTTPTHCPARRTSRIRLEEARRSVAWTQCAHCQRSRRTKRSRPRQDSANCNPANRPRGCRYRSPSHRRPERHAPTRPRSGDGSPGSRTVRRNDHRARRARRGGRPRMRSSFHRHDPRSVGGNQRRQLASMARPAREWSGAPRDAPGRVERGRERPLARRCARSGPLVADRVGRQRVSAVCRGG